MPSRASLQDSSIQGETPLMWPLWLRAAVPGNISMYITIYYEIKDVSSIIKYRMLRMHYYVQVCASMLEIVFLFYLFSLLCTFCCTVYSLYRDNFVGLTI